LNPCYVGPLFTTGGAMTEINRYISEMAPEKIGHFTSNNLVLIETDTLQNQIYTFSKVTAYKVTKDSNSFNIMYLKCIMGGEEYEIVVEIALSRYTRTLKLQH
jgi:hypothetical protein